MEGGGKGREAEDGRGRGRERDEQEGGGKERGEQEGGGGGKGRGDRRRERGVGRGGNIRTGNLPRKIPSVGNSRRGDRAEQLGPRSAVLAWCEVLVVCAAEEWPPPDALSVSLSSEIALEKGNGWDFCELRRDWQAV